MIEVKYVPKLSLIFQDLLNETYIPELIEDLNVSLTAEINVNSDNITKNAANIKILEEGTFFYSYYIRALILVID